jgi:hypothetical protein
LPQGARIWLSFTEAISSKTASPGDPVILELVNELKIGDATVAEAGHKVYGKVLSVSRAHAPGLSGELEIQISPLEWVGLRCSFGAQRAKGTAAVSNISAPLP